MKSDRGSTGDVVRPAGRSDHRDETSQRKGV